MAMARGHSSLGQLSPYLVTHGIQTPKTTPTKSLPIRFTHSMYASQANPTATHSWSEDLFHKPSQHIEPPIPSPSPSSKPPEDVATCEPEPEVASTQCMEEPFGSPPCISPAPTLPPSTPVPPPPWCQAPLIPTMTLARNSPTCDQY
ncbi:hypothetical protein O181_035939 [Austropuccinia psidii MF-1]|uniref:Uncharacterized protein n=1 Tax=Austropuccinia psidii MF-1 TaxID=1389203 RepID=A0A9Q3HB18_9BASI|nr:hypothetical protein [Austropuccinia psidii MF-1]